MEILNLDYASIKLFLQDIILKSNLSSNEMDILIKIIKYTNQEHLIKVIGELRLDKNELEEVEK